MTAMEAAIRLEHVLARDQAGRFSFMCRKAFVTVKLHGKPERFRFAAKDGLAFRTESDGFTVEKCDGRLHKKFSWDQIECLAAGEPEKDDGTLFQG